MEILMFMSIFIQIILMVFIILAYFNNDRSEVSKIIPPSIDTSAEEEALLKLKQISLTKPLSEITRPTSLNNIIGQEDSINTLRAVLCGHNPQHVLIYGPAGVGKTAAARLILEEAKKNPLSPFLDDAKFVELDATTLRFDERSIADPLIGSVHDPIYQGAGAYGQAGIPQPKMGAVTKAHGGILFIDEIGELPSAQMNKLLKVLEDRKVNLESAYYSPSNKNIPTYIHDIFKNGFPADFRLVGATTRSPEDIPPAIRSRCCEIFFNPLKPSHIKTIAANAALSTAITCTPEAIERITRFSKNGRDTVNIIQTAASLAALEKRTEITLNDINRVARSSHLQPLSDFKNTFSDIGTSNGLGVTPSGLGMLLKIEATATEGTGKIDISGIIEEESIKNGSVIKKRKGTAVSSIKNALCILKNMGFKTNSYDFYINFPGGIPVDGPSAGCAIFTAMYSALIKQPILSDYAMTGEIDIFGNVLPVGGVDAKTDAAAEAEMKHIFAPLANKDTCLDEKNIEIIYISNVSEILDRITSSVTINANLTA